MAAAWAGSVLGSAGSWAEGSGPQLASLEGSPLAQMYTLGSVNALELGLGPGTCFEEQPYLKPDRRSMVA